MKTDIKLTQVSTSQVIELGRCELIAVYLTSSAAENATVIVYDGHNTTGKKIHNISVPASTSHDFDPLSNLILENGLYIKLYAGADSCLVLTRSLE